MAMSAGPNDTFNEAISFRVNCSSQFGDRHLLERAAEKWRKTAGLRLDRR
jgi:hypothetical protein